MSNVTRAIATRERELQSTSGAPLAGRSEVPLADGLVSGGPQAPSLDLPLLGRSLSCKPSSEHAPLASPSLTEKLRSVSGETVVEGSLSEAVKRAIGGTNGFVHRAGLSRTTLLPRFVELERRPPHLVHQDEEALRVPVAHVNSVGLQRRVCAGFPYH